MRLPAESVAGDGDPGTGHRQRVLAVATFFPWPQNHGDALRRLMVLEALAAHGDLTAVCIARPETSPDDVTELGRRLDGARLIVVPPWQSDLRRLSGRLARVGRGAVTVTPPWIYRQWNPGVAATIRTLCADPFDLAVLIGEPAGAFAPAARAHRLVWDKSNVLTASDLDALRSLSSPVRRARALAGLPFSYAFERRVLRRVDEVVVTSDEEADRLHRHFGAVPATTIPSAVELAPPAPGVDVRSRTLLWLSTLSYTPNWDGLLRFLRGADDVLRRNGWTVRVVGAGARPAQVEVLRSYPYVDYRGYVDDLADACVGVCAGVVPIWAGAGVKLKTLTMMSLGVPLVATPVALEGIPPEAAARVVGTAAEFAPALTSLTPEELGAAARRGRRILEDQFSDAVFSRRVARLLDGTGRNAVR